MTEEKPCDEIVDKIIIGSIIVKPNKFMKIKTLLCFLLLYSFTTLNVNGQSCAITGSGQINVNETKTYSVSATTGASQFWSVTGGLTIVGSNTGTSVSVKGVSTGSAQVCVTKFKAGSQPCCECKSITVVPVPVVCAPQPSINMLVCTGYPSVHPHWRFDILEQFQFDNTGTYSWSATGFTFDTNTNQSNIIGRPTSGGYFTLYCTVTYPCPTAPGGIVTYNLSFTYFASDCGGLIALSAESFPNPFSASTTIEYSIPEDGSVSMVIKSLDGEKVASPILNEAKKQGKHSIRLSGDIFPQSGMYIMNIYFNNSPLIQRRLMKE